MCIERAHYYFIANRQMRRSVHVLFCFLAVDLRPTKQFAVGHRQTLNTAKFETLVENYHSSLWSKLSFIIQCLKLYNRTIATGGTIAAFVAGLQKIAEHCKYKDILKDMLRDQLVRGVNHKGIQCKLLADNLWKSFGNCFNHGDSWKRYKIPEDQ